MSRKFGFIPLVMIFLLLILPELSLNGATKGVRLWAEHIVPTLFPFMTVSMMLRLSGILSRLGFIARPVTKFLRVPEAAFDAIVSGFVSGCPVGAGITASLVNDGLIRQEEAGYVAAISSFCSPVFVLSTVGVKLAGNRTVGFFVLAAFYVSWILTVLILRPKGYAPSQKASEYAAPSAGGILKISVESGVKTILVVGGYIVLFSVLTEFITNIGILPQDGLVRCIVSSFLELSSACNDIVLSGFKYYVMLPFLCFAVAWGGLCIFLQVNGSVNGIHGTGAFILKFKALQAIIAAVMGVIIAVVEAN